VTNPAALPPPWSSDGHEAKLGLLRRVRDHGGQALAYATFSPKTTPVCGFT